MSQLNLLTITVTIKPIVYHRIHGHTEDWLKHDTYFYHPKIDRAVIKPTFALIMLKSKLKKF